ncbi:mitochondrial 54S ribosomal protein uL30m [Lodderomyces beijingensis]|uniref:Large ribosomal subunit protein uL30m n=1 Tax=Lodderomyces beijingensis TaxID=1775926 RepID=A0ABP0ZJ43_9ASCO
MSAVSQQPVKSLYYKITQIRSTIGMPPKTRSALHALGLRRRNQVVFAKCAPSSANTLTRVKEMVKVEVTDYKLTREEVNRARKFPKGFELIKNGTLKTYE